MASPFGSAPGVIVGVAVGAAAGAAITPAFEVPRQIAWRGAPYRLLPVDTIATLIAQGGVPLDAAAIDEAHRDGYGEDKLRHLIYLAQTVPGTSEAFSLWRRGLIGDGDFTHTLVKAGLDARYLDPIRQLKTAELIGIGDWATAVVRGAVPAPSWMPVAPPTQTTNVKRFPVTNLDPIAEAAKLGFSEDQFRIMVARSGLSLAPGLAAQARFRDLIAEDDFLLAIAEGDLRTEWADTLLNVSRQIPGALDYVQGRLRGWISDQAMQDGAARHGMTPADVELLYKIHGRPPSLRQVFIGQRRGGKYEPNNDGTAADNPDIPAYALKALQESDIRPEWFNLMWAQRETLPSAFVLRSLTQAGDLTPAETEGLLLDAGWPADLAAKVPPRWAGGSGTVSDPHVTKAENQLWTRTHASYVAEESDDTAARSALAALAIPAAAQDQILALWQHERSLIRKQLTPAQLKKALKEGVTNPATGAAWTRDEVLTELVDRGYSLEDATVFLDL